METVRSSDGTTIAFERTGAGAPLILVVGAFNERSAGTPLAQWLASTYTVFTYDRRGRGDSTDTAPYRVEREVEDLAALIAHAGGSAAVFGYSSGAILALLAAAHGLGIDKLALFDTPLDLQPQPLDHAAKLQHLIDANRRGDAVEYFQKHLVGIPDPIIEQLRHAPFRPALGAIAHTLVYDATLVGMSSSVLQRANAVATPACVIAGGNSPFMRAAADAVARALPNARTHVLEGKGHDIEPDVIGPLLDRFLAS